MRYIVFAILSILAMAVSVQAADKMLTATVDSVTIANDKNGNEYARVIVLEPKDIDGASYVVGTAVMCFRDTATQAKSLKKGDKLKAIVSEREYQGRKSYTLIAWPSK
jgi:hypothetical protein